MFDISIFITNWNGYKHGYLQEALPSILNAAKNYRLGKYEIIVVDDCSEDRSIEYIRDNYSEIKVIKTFNNLGYQGASNFAVEYCKYDILISLNNDIKLEKDVLNKIVDHFADSEVFAVSTKVIMWDEETYLAGKRYAVIENGHFKLVDAGDTIKTVSPTLFATGGAAAFRKSMYIKLGGFDRIYYPLYWEDVDLCYRALKRGWKVLHDPECIMYHKHQATITKMYDRKNIGIISARNSYIFYWKNITDKDLLLQNIFYTIIFDIRDLFKLKFRFIKASFLAFLKLFKILKRKKEEKKCFVKTDREILKEIK